MRLVLVLLLCSAPVWAETVNQKTLAEVIAIGETYKVPESVVKALMHEESGGDPKAQGRLVNGYRAEGLFQIYTEPDNYKYLLWKYWKSDKKFDIFNPTDNAEVALHYLADLHKQFHSWYKALLFFNSGRVAGAPESSKEYALRIITAK